MSTRLAVMSDTHVPGRAESIPSWVRDRTLSADHVVHAGDFDSTAALATVRELAGGPEGLTAVQGNIDPDLGLPEVEVLDVEGVRFVVVHGNGLERGYQRRVVGQVREHAAPDRPTVSISGHSHEVLDEERGGIRLLNPGSATGAFPASGATMMTIDVVDGAVDVTLYPE